MKHQTDVRAPEGPAAGQGRGARPSGMGEELGRRLCVLRPARAPFVLSGLSVPIQCGPVHA